MSIWNQTRLSALTALAAVSITAQSPPIPARLAVGFESIREAPLRADLTFLASDPLQGRLSLQAGDEVAIQWVAAEYAKAGLKPPAGDTYLQPVELIEY